MKILLVGLLAYLAVSTFGKKAGTTAVTTVMSKAKAQSMAAQLYPTATQKQKEAIAANLQAIGSPTGTAYEPAYDPMSGSYSPAAALGISNVPYLPDYPQETAGDELTPAQIDALADAWGIYY